jgi:membrane protease YdiL (CAAX protease family)
MSTVKVLSRCTNRQLILPYALPYLAYVAIASFFDELLSIEANYALRIVVVVSLLVWARRWYFSFKGPHVPFVSVAFGLAGGLVGCLIWIGLLSPFVEHTETAAWSRSAFLLRLAAAGLLVPVFEELLMRGFVFRLALQWDQARKLGDREPLQTALDDKSVNEVDAGSWSWMAVAISTIAFTSGHHIEEWPASIAFGLLMSFMWVYRKDLLSCIVAHSVTNIALGCYVLLTGNWQLW